jgi:hypothetical protein
MGVTFSASPRRDQARRVILRWTRRMVVALEADGFGLLLAFLFLGLGLVLWILSLALLVGDSISPVMKILWLVALTCLAPFAIPIYLLSWSLRLSGRSARGA